MGIKTGVAALACGLVFGGVSAQAGDFVSLPSTDPLRVEGSGINALDPLYLDFGPLPARFVELAAAQTTVMDEESGLELGTFYDRVFRDTTDSMLIFASRLELTRDENDFSPFEVNDIQRAGFTGYGAAVAWWDQTGADFRLKSAARTAQGLVRNDDGSNTPDTYDPDIIDMRTDVSGPEDAYQSGWYLIKTDATEFRWMESGVNVYTANEDVSAEIVDRWINGYAPAAPVPEPSDYALLLAGLGVLHLVVRRRTRA